LSATILPGTGASARGGRTAASRGEGHAYGWRYASIRSHRRRVRLFEERPGVGRDHVQAPDRPRPRTAGPGQIARPVELDAVDPGRG
jgi:hypothetical protein